HAQADQAMAEGNYAQAYCLLHPLAEAGDTKAEHDIGWMYANGYGLAVDESKAIIWWRKAAREGHGNAQFALAMAYLAGEGVERDEAAAIEWLIKAANNGIEDALPVIRSRASRGSEEAKLAILRLVQSDPELIGRPAIVDVRRANIREAAHKDGKLITTLSEGAALVHMADQGQWSQVGIVESGLIGWVYKPLIKVEGDDASEEKAGAN
ncbi:MAG: hypothetical protein ACPG4N_13045, partial [Gammaproteobacteria bacterium]